MSTLAHFLDELTVEGELYETLPDGAIRCTACGHRCLIREGRRGICQVRFNQGGKLRVPWGYVAALQADPIEKKPFFHFLSGTDALTFGMLGCDFHCSYCFPGETVVATNRGPAAIADLFASSQRLEERLDGEIGYPDDLHAVAASGKLRPVRAVFKHPYRGRLVTIQPFYLPELRCTADHRVYATKDPSRPPEPVTASQLTGQHYLAVPYRHSFSDLQVIQAAEVLCEHQVTYRIRWDLTTLEREAIMAATARGETSRQIGSSIEKDASYIRHVRSKIARGIARDSRTAGPLIEAGRLRFPNEHHPGIPVEIPVDEDMARLLGYYCAEGSIVQSKRRPNSLVLNFSFSPQEIRQVEEVVSLIQKCLGIKASIVSRPTTLCVSVTKSSAALLFKALAGKGAQEKHVPTVIYQSPKHVIEAFLRAYIEGDGHYFDNGKISATSVSRELAYGISWLVLKIGYLPSLYVSIMPEQGLIQGRLINRADHQYTIEWYENSPVRRKAIRTNSYYLVPLRSVTMMEYDGDVYNMEVEEEHNYLAGFFLVSNCQNHLTSQAMRDPASDVAAGLVRRVSPEQLVGYALSAGAGVIASSYNEPLITSEWAVAVFKQAKEAGLKCAYISNGNLTPEVLQYLRPYLDGYKIDLKTMQDKPYRQLGGVLDRVLDGIRMAHSLGLWVEVVTLVIPGFNDSTEELLDAARFIHTVSPDIPWHVTAFHPDYKMTDPSPTSVKTLLRAAEIGQEAGLNYVYAGNLPGQVQEYENTRCPQCSALLVERYGYIIHSYRLTAQGACPKCGTAIPGLWTDRPETVHLDGFGMPRLVIR